MKTNKFIIIILFIAIALYFSQGWLFEKGSIIPQSMLVLWLLIDVVYLFKTINQKLVDSWGWLLISFGVVMLFDWILSDKVVVGPDGWRVRTLDDLKNISVFLLSYFPFRYHAAKQVLNEKNVRFFFWILLVVFIMIYFSNERNLLEIRETEDVTNNNAFTFVMLFPLIGLFFDKKYKYILVFVMLYFVLMGAKRGAWVCFFIELLLFFSFSFRSFTKRQSWLGIMGILIGLVATVALVFSLYQSNDYIQYRFDLMVRGEDSGRSYIWNILKNGFQNGSFIQMLFGHGMDSTISIAGMYAHNDWYQLLIDSGLVGVTIYFLMFFSLFKFYFRNKKSMPNNIKFMYLSAVLCWFLKSLFSMGYTSPFSFILLFSIIFSHSAVCQIKTNLYYATNSNISETP